MPNFSGPELCARSASNIVGLLKAREVSPEEVLEASLARVAEVDRQVNAMPTLCADRARGQIAGLDDLREQFGQNPGWLAGLPIGIKDLAAVRGVRSTWGTVALKDFVPEVSAPYVDNLEHRGAVILGKTNTPEMGAGGNTFNDVFGYTRNPWDLRKNAGGSSGGAAVSLATGEVWLSHGSDLAGSLRTPAAYCGVVGLRPTPGRAGGGPADTAFEIEAVQGPMARNVTDVALFLDAMTGFDPRQPLTLEAPRQSFQSAVLRDAGKIRIGFTPDMGGFAPVEPEIETVMRVALRRIQTSGVRVAEDCPDLDGLEATYITLRGMLYGSLNARVPAEVQQHFKKTLVDNIAVGKALQLEDIYDMMRQRTVLYHNMRLYLEQFDVMACPVVGLEPGPVEQEYPLSVAGVPTGDYVDWLKFSYLATATCLPAISIPCGFTKTGMPVGLQLIGPPRGEARLLQVAKFLEDVWGFANGVPIDPVEKV
jgi:amidase